MSLQPVSSSSSRWVSQIPASAIHRPSGPSASAVAGASAPDPPWHCGSHCKTAEITVSGRLSVMPDEKLAMLTKLVDHA